MNYSFIQNKSQSFSLESHSLNVGVATKTKSANAALIFNHILFWVKENQKNKVNFIDEKTWMYQSIPKIANHFPYLSHQQIKDSINLLVQHGFLLKSNYSKNNFLRTNWYTISIPKEEPEEEEPIEDDREEIKENSTVRSTDPMHRVHRPDEAIEHIPYINNISIIDYKREDVSDLSDPPKGDGLTVFFYEKLKEINPKIRKPNFDSWQKQMTLLMTKDERSEEEIREVIEFIVFQHKNPKRDFTWSKAVISPEKLRKHFATIWLEMHTKTPTQKKQQESDQKLKTIESNRDWAKKIKLKIDVTIPNHLRFYVNDSYITLEDKHNRNAFPLGYEENGFREIVNNFFRKQGIVF